MRTSIPSRGNAVRRAAAGVVAVLALVSQAGSAAPAPDDDREARFAQSVLTATTREWTEAFAVQGKTYTPPRLVMVAPARGHPGRGSGYGRGILLIDAGELADVRALFPADADALIALLVAHEAAHHAQALWRQRSRSETERELQADCLAGWTLERMNVRDARSSDLPHYDWDGLEQRFPRLLLALSMLGPRYASSVRGERADDHGSADQRVAAIRRGSASKAVAGCGLGA